MRMKILALVVLSFCTMLLLVGFLFTAINRQGKTPVQISVFPNDSTITLNEKGISAGTIYLEPGTYTLAATKDGFDDHSEIITIEEGGEEKIRGVILTPNTAETLQWAKENEAEYDKVFGDAQEAAAEIGRTFNERNPIARDLPYKTFFYSVGYRMDKSDPSGNSIIIEIDAQEGYRQSALFRIRQLGYDPTDFTINFRDYENPFSL